MSGASVSVRKVLIVYNARSGHRRVDFKKYLGALDELGAQVDVRVIGRRFNLEELLKGAETFDRVVVAGGDGTVAGAAGLLQGTGVPVVAYPGGTANLLSRNLGMPADPAALAHVTLHSPAVVVDLGELEYIRYYRSDRLRKRFLKRVPKRVPKKIYFAIMAGCGFAAQLISQAQPLKSRWGEAAYWLSSLWNFFPRQAVFSLVLDGKKIETRGIGVLIVNFARIQFDIKVVSGGDAQDGEFEIAVLKARSLLGLLPVLYGAVLERLGFDRPAMPEIMETYRARDMEIHCRPPLKLQFDGEVLKKAAGFRVRACRRAAHFIQARS